MIILMRSFEQRVFYSTLHAGKNRQAAGRNAAAAPLPARRSGTIADPHDQDPNLMDTPQHTFLDVAGQRLMRLADNGLSPASRTSPTFWA